MNPKVYGYIRVSTGEQGKGFSLDGQRSEIEKYCEKNQLQLLEIFEDQSSGTRLFDRSGLMAMIEAINPSVHAVIATESDRLSRDVFQYGWLSTHLQRQGITIQFVNECKSETPSEKAFSKIRAVFSEFETELRQARIRRGIDKAKSYNRFMNRPPLGYRMEQKQIVIDKKTSRIVKEVFILAANGFSLREIADMTGIKRSTTGFVLKNDFYIEQNRHGKHDLFISSDLWRFANQRIKHRLKKVI